MTRLVHAQVESRPLVLVAARTEDGVEHSIIVQNAETVKLVGPPGQSSSGVTTTQTSTPRAVEEAARHEHGGSTAAQASDASAASVQSASAVSAAQRAQALPDAGGAWRAIAVTDLRVGDALFVRRSDAGRHMGHAIQEQLRET